MLYGAPAEPSEADLKIICRGPRRAPRRQRRPRRAGKLVQTTQERWAEAEMHRLRGTLLLSMSKHAEAENSYRQALSVAQRQSAKFWELRAAMSMARLWLDQGKREEARELFAPIYRWFT